MHKILPNVFNDFALGSDHVSDCKVQVKLFRGHIHQLIHGVGNKHNLPPFVRIIALFADNDFSSTHALAGFGISTFSRISGAVIAKNIFLTSKTAYN